MSEAAYRAEIMRRRRMVLAQNPDARQEAIADFILITASIAADLRRITEFRRLGGNMTSQDNEAAMYMEDLIRGQYRDLFGTELGQ